MDIPIPAWNKPKEISHVLLELTRDFSSLSAWSFIGCFGVQAHPAWSLWSRWGKPSELSRHYSLLVLQVWQFGPLCRWKQGRLETWQAWQGESCESLFISFPRNQLPINAAKEKKNLPGTEGEILFQNEQSNYQSLSAGNLQQMTNGCLLLITSIKRWMEVLCVQR